MEKGLLYCVGKPAWRDDRRRGTNKKEGFSLKKKLSILLLASLLLGLTAGCGGEPKAETPMGRYVEKPGQALEGLDWVDSLRRTETGDLVFYGRDISSGKAVYYRCVMPAEGESVEKMEVSWLNEFLEVEGKDRLLIQISEGADGTVYVLYNEIDHEAMEGSYAYHGPLLARSTNGGVPETLSVAELEENSKDTGSFSYVTGNDGTFTFGGSVSSSGEVSDPPEGKKEEDEGSGEGEDAPGEGLISGGSFDVSVDSRGSYTFGGSAERLNCQGVTALEDGFLLLFGTKGVYRYNTDGVKTAEFPGQVYGAAGVGSHKGSLLVATAEGFATYDLGTMKESGAYVYDSPDLFAHIGMDDKGIYLADSTGIYRQTLGGGILERLVDANMTSLIMPNQTMECIVSDGEDGFWAILYDAEDVYQLVHYDFDPDMPTNPDTELTIFALRDNATVRQTIGEFQRANPNVRVNFRVAEDGSSAATAEELIRTLNTELLNGKGPDLLLLDGLPVESYMEKGVLADITDILEEKDGTLLSNLMEVYTREGKVYGVPSKFTVPVMMGAGESLSGLDSLEELVKRTTEPGEPPFLRATQAVWDEENTGMLMTYYDLFARNLLKNGELDQAALTAYFETVCKLDAAVKAYTPQIGDSTMAAITVIASTGRGLEFIDMGSNDLRGGKARIHLGTMSGLGNLTQAVGNLYAMGGQALESTFHGNYYIPVGTVGVLEGSRQKELAKDFLRMMLSGTVQDDYVYDGFPVNAASLEKLMAEALEDSYFGSPKGEDMGFLALCRELDTPVLVDQVVKDAVTGQAKELLSGAVTPEQAAANVAEKLKLYLAE